jgi:hypothetical protein
MLLPRRIMRLPDLALGARGLLSKIDTALADLK